MNGRKRGKGNSSPFQSATSPPVTFWYSVESRSTSA